MFLFLKANFIRVKRKYTDYSSQPEGMEKVIVENKIGPGPRKLALLHCSAQP